MIFLNVPAGNYRIGSTRENIEACIEAWKRRLIKSTYTESEFREWIEKEYPAHLVETKGFEMAQTLVTNAEAKEFVEATHMPAPDSVYETPDNHPVWGAALEWANEFAKWKSRRDREFTYRLPTETEWEIAARGGDFRQYPYGNEFNPQAANTVESKIGTTTPVDHYKNTPGPFGHYDLAGNVEEWVSTKYYVYDGGRLVKDNLYEQFGMDYAVLRGGNFCCGGDLSRSARRHGPFPDSLFSFIGFRLVRERKV
jgi:formylglycine-generating enzyme required for sulfatase activity